MKKEKTTLTQSIKIGFNKTKIAIKNFIKDFNINSYLKLYLGVVFLLAIIFFAYLLLDYFGVLARFSSAEELQKIIQSDYKVVSILIYWSIQFLQVTFLPIPAIVTTAAGVFVFGNGWEPVIYSLLAIIPASFLAFFLGRWLGKPFVSWMVGKDNMEKYLKKTEGKEKPLFFMMFLLPFFPDDILCMVAGITKMSTKFFTIIQIVCRPPAVICTILMFNGIINLNFLRTWYGIIIIIVLAILFITAIVVSIKYATQIEDFFVKIGNKFKRKKKNVDENNK